MTSKNEDRSGGKRRPRKAKSDRREQKAHQPRSAEPGSGEEDRNTPTLASAEVAADHAGEPAPVFASQAAEPVGLKADDAAEAAVLASDVVERAESLANAVSAAAEPAANAAANASAVALIGEVIPPDVPSAGLTGPTAGFPVTLLAIGDCYGEYLRRSLQDNRSFVERLMRVRSLEQLIEVQSEFARQAYANFVAETQKLCDLSGELARQVFRPFGIASIPHTRRHMT